MRRGFLYLVAVMDWATRKVLSWRVSNTMEAEFCIEALEEALERFGRPEIFNTDQGSQGGFKWSSQHDVRWLTEATYQTPRQVFSTQASFGGGR
jgi:transposase InsO family protein